ncbi:putative all-trans-retinol 13,14-reductase [groundwater metagenome]|uniref:Putative all-trans-retinol 13,14-reductase n=1 Tax=groundwater metagenome TaxID=717931 RepID=A0A098E8Y2_9ZZZZ
MNNKRKIPGMLYILVSFIPWIIYWILCGMGDKSGIIIPLAVSLLLVIPQIRKQDFNLMDLTSVFYFVIAAAGTFILNLNIFVENSGSIGYFALFLMALFSLIIRQPYTLQISKKDYPEIYWKDKSFLLINTMITGIWAGIYIANVFVFFFLQIPLSIILSNVLIAFGIVFSIVFPLKAPVYFTLREFKKYDWDVEADTQKPKDEKEYDVIIIGSGIGGLTCGALLSKKGYKVLIVEQHYQVGGYFSSFQRNGFVFTAGVEDVSGLWENGPVTNLLNELNLNKGDLFVKTRKRYIFKGREIDIPDNVNDCVKLLSGIFPDERENISSFFADVEKSYTELHKDMVYGVSLPDYLIAKIFGNKIADYPKDHPHLSDWLNKTYQQKLDEYFKNNDLKALLCVLIPHIGTTPEETQGNNALSAVLSYYLYGGYFPKGGMNFALALKKFIEKYNGKILLKHKVDKILVENGKVTGVKVKNDVFSAPVVVSNADAKTTFMEFIGEENLDKGFVEYIKNLRMSVSCFIVFLGVDMDLSDYPTHIMDSDNGYFLIINSNADPDLSPKGKASITIITNANYCEFPERMTKEYSQKKKEFAERLIKKAENAIPDLGKHIVVQDSATPKTFERYVSMPEGAIYGFDQSIKTKRPYFKTPIKGIYLTGASTFPGGGIEAVVISGVICARDICNWKI